MDTTASSSSAQITVDDYLLSEVQMEPTFDVDATGLNMNVAQPILPWYKYKEEHAHEITTPPPKYHVEELNLEGLPHAPLTKVQRAEIEAKLNIDVSPVPPKEAQKEWRCVGRENAPADGPKVIEADPKYRWFTLAEPLGCQMIVRRQPAQLTSRDEQMREDVLIPEEMAKTQIDLRAAVIKLQRRYRAYGKRTWRKVGLLRKMKERLDEEERRRLEEEERQKKEEEERMRKEEEERVRREEEERARREEEEHVEAERAIEEARQQEIERLAAAERLAVSPAESAEQDQWALTMAPIAPPQPSATFDKGKGIAISGDDEVQIVEPEYAAETHGTDEDRAEIRRKIELLRAGVAQGRITRDDCEAGVIQIRDTNRWPSAVWEKTFDFERWNERRQATKRAITDVVADVNASLEASDEVNQGATDEGVVESRLKKTSTAGPTASRKSSAKTGTPPLVLTTPADKPKRFVDGAFAIYKGAKDRNVYPERPFHPNVLKNDDFRRYILERGMRKMVKVEGNASFELTREFYANLAATYAKVDTFETGNPMQFKMRGVEVDFSPDRINEYFNRIEIPDELAAKHDDLVERMDRGRKEGTWAAVRALCETDDEDVYHNHPRTLVRWKCTPDKYKSWLEWVGSHVYVTARVTEIASRAYFVWNELRQAHPIDLGKQIRASMIRMALNPRISMGHTHLIRDICRAQRVPIDDNELTIPPGRPILLRKAWLDMARWTITQPTIARTPANQRPTPTKRKATDVPAPRPTKKTKASAPADVGPSTHPSPATRTTTVPATRPSPKSKAPPPPKQVQRQLATPEPLPAPPSTPDLPNTSPFEKYVMATCQYLLNAVTRLDGRLDTLAREQHRTSRTVNATLDEVTDRHADLRRQVKELTYGIKRSHQTAFNSFVWPSDSEAEGNNDAEDDANEGAE